MWVFMLSLILSVYLSYSFFFFFSSRRRHTRYWRDWSSDVCSSDLTGVLFAARGVGALLGPIVGRQVIARNERYLWSVLGTWMVVFAVGYMALAAEIGRASCRERV